MFLASSDLLFCGQGVRGALMHTQQTAFALLIIHHRRATEVQRDCCLWTAHETDPAVCTQLLLQYRSILSPISGSPLWTVPHPIDTRCRRTRRIKWHVRQRSRCQCRTLSTFPHGVPLTRLCVCDAGKFHVRRLLRGSEMP